MSTPTAALNIYLAASSPDPLVQLPALIAIRKAKIAALERTRTSIRDLGGNPRRQRTQLTQHRRMIRKYAAELSRLTGKAVEA